MSMHYPRFIAITGIDGSGKTTIAKRLIKYLKSRGYGTKYVWIKSLHSFAYVLSNLLTLLVGYQVVVNPNNVDVKRFDHSRYRRFWPLIEFISVLPLFVSKIYLPFSLGYVIVSDRCVIDTVVTISTRIKDPFFMNSCISRILLRMVPKGAVIIHFNVELTDVLKRKPDIEYTFTEINHQILLYNLLARRMGAHTVNTSELSINETLEATLNAIRTL